jgi:hypothetical protein
MPGATPAWTTSCTSRFTLAQLGASLQRLFPAWSAPGLAAIIGGAETASEENSSDALLDASVLRELEEMAGPAGVGFMRRVFGLYLENVPRIRANWPAPSGTARRTPSRALRMRSKSMSHNIGARKGRRGGRGDRAPRA